MTEGFKQAGFNVVGAIEIDADACEVYPLNHPKTQLWPRGIETVSVADVLKTLGIEAGELDLLGGCPPCSRAAGCHAVGQCE